MNPANLFNAALFQVAWFACVLGGARDTSSWGVLSVLALLVYALTARTRRADLTMGLVAAVLGFLVDTLWIRTGILDYQGAAVAPLWIVLLWVGVGLTINHSLSLFKARPWLGGVLAGACAPLSYLAGERLGAVTIADPWLLPVVSLVWAALFVVAFTVAAEADRSTTVVPSRRSYERAH
jgi:hypothetical protein